jgi:hypothetical protein
MVAHNPATRTLVSRIAAHEKWAATPDRTAATAPARRAFTDRFLREARERFPDMPERALPDAAEQLRKAYYTRLALKSAEARRARAKPAA